jgi:3-oxoacyl-[acyl-carrier protein] reductase
MQGKIALVTGASRGIGQAIALAFAKEGADVVVNATSLVNLEETVKQIKALGGKVIAIAADVADEHEVNEMVDKVIQELGGIDILVSNAGIGFPGIVEDMKKEEWDRVFAVNLRGPFNCVKAVIELMKRRGGGKIIVIGSISGNRISASLGAHYTSSKAAILGFIRQLAYELGPFGINVNCVNPGVVLTSHTEKGAPASFWEEKKIMFPLRELVKPEDIANAVIFLASDKARTITGTTIDVDAGMSLGWGLISAEIYARHKKSAGSKG